MNFYQKFKDLYRTRYEVGSCPRPHRKGIEDWFFWGNEMICVKTSSLDGSKFDRLWCLVEICYSVATCNVILNPITVGERIS